MEGLISIPATHLETAPIRADDAKGMTPSAISRDEIPTPLNQNLSAPWLHLEILSIKVMKRIGIKQRPWWRLIMYYIHVLHNVLCTIYVYSIDR